MNDAGKFLAGNEFGVAVIVVYSGMTGDAQMDLVLTQARAAVVRAYLSIQHFEDVENSCPMVALPTDVTVANS